MKKRMTIFDKMKYELAVFLYLSLMFIPAYKKLGIDSDSQLLEGLILAFGAVFIIFASFLSGRLIGQTAEGGKDVTAFFLLLFLVLPYTAAAFNSRLVYIDRLSIFILVLALSLLNKKGFKWLLPGLLLLALALNRQFVFFYIPFIFVILLDHAHKNNFSKQSLAFVATCFLSLAIFASYFYLNPVLNLPALEAGTADVGLYKSALTFILFVSPLLLIFLATWIKATKNATDKFEKFIFLICLAILLFDLGFLFFFNYGMRQKTALLIVQFFFIFYFLHNKNSTVLIFTDKIANFLEKHTYLALVFVAYGAMPYMALATGTIWDLILGPLDRRLF